MRDGQLPPAIRTAILAAARRLIAGELGVIEASRALAPFWHYAPPELEEVLLTFSGIDSETDSLPIGDVRQHWSTEALERKDREIAEAEDFYRKTAIEAATHLIVLIESLQ